MELSVRVVDGVERINIPIPDVSESEWTDFVTDASSLTPSIVVDWVIIIQDVSASWLPSDNVTFTNDADVCRCLYAV